MTGSWKFMVLDFALLCVFKVPIIKRRKNPQKKKKKKALPTEVIWGSILGTRLQRIGEVKTAA